MRVESAALFVVFTFGVLLGGMGNRDDRAYLTLAAVQAQTGDPARVNGRVDGGIDAPGVTLPADVDRVGLALPNGETIGIERFGLAFGHDW